MSAATIPLKYDYAIADHDAVEAVSTRARRTARIRQALGLVAAVAAAVLASRVDPVLSVFVGFFAFIVGSCAEGTFRERGVRWHMLRRSGLTPAFERDGDRILVDGDAPGALAVKLAADAWQLAVRLDRSEDEAAAVDLFSKAATLIVAHREAEALDNPYRARYRIEKRMDEVWDSAYALKNSLEELQRLGVEQRTAAKRALAAEQAARRFETHTMLVGDVPTPGQVTEPTEALLAAHRKLASF